MAIGWASDELLGGGQASESKRARGQADYLLDAFERIDDVLSLLGRRGDEMMMTEWEWIWIGHGGGGGIFLLSLVGAQSSLQSLSVRGSLARNVFF